MIYIAVGYTILAVIGVIALAVHVKETITEIL
jgi:hypothetical protein